MVRHHILDAFLVPDFEYKLLEEDPPKKTRLGILLV